VTNVNSSNASVIGPNGDVLTAADLPPQGATRWVPRRKAEIVAAVSGGLLSLTEACQRYRISHEEFQDWARAYAQNGLVGLRARRKRTVASTSIDAQSLPDRALLSN
jgi:transposase-like protein